MKTLRESEGKAQRVLNRDRDREKEDQKVAPMNDAGKQPLLPGWPCSIQNDL